MMHNSSAAVAPNAVSIARQPVFDEKRRLWGYTLSCVGSQLPWSYENSDAHNAAFEVATSTYLGLQQIIGRNQKILTNFSEKNILDNLPYALPPALTAVQVSESVFLKPAVPDILQQLKNDGYLIAMAGFTNHSDCASLYHIADIISIDVRDKSRERLEETLAQATSYGGSMLCMHVEEPRRFAMCKELVFNLFHGPFFKTPPDTITVRKLSSNEVSRFKLMQAIEKTDIDFNQLAETIQADASISFRLLSYLNSGAFGLRQKVTSIQQAVSLLGWRKMKNWLRVVLLNDVNQSPEAPELMVLAAQRGKFLELIAKDYDYWGFDPESLHMLGIFSLLDAMLEIPMGEITTHLPLNEKLKDALKRESNNEYLPLLELALCLEEGRWEEAQKMVRQLNLDEGKVKSAFQKAVDWADAMNHLQATSDG